MKGRDLLLMRNRRSRRKSELEGENNCLRWSMAELHSQLQEPDPLGWNFTTSQLTFHLLLLLLLQLVSTPINRITLSCKYTCTVHLFTDFFLIQAQLNMIQAQLNMIIQARNFMIGNDDYYINLVLAARTTHDSH